MAIQGITPEGVEEVIKDLIKDKVVCDVGCGTGEFMQRLSKYAKKVIGIEENDSEAWECALKGFDTYSENAFFHPLPKADVYYLWTKDCVGLFLKAKFEGTKGTFIFGHSVRPSTAAFFKKIKAREIKFGDWIIHVKKI